MKWAKMHFVNFCQLFLEQHCYKNRIFAPKIQKCKSMKKFFMALVSVLLLTSFMVPASYTGNYIIKLIWGNWCFWGYINL